MCWMIASGGVRLAKQPLRERGAVTHGPDRVLFCFFVCFVFLEFLKLHLTASGQSDVVWLFGFVSYVPCWECSFSRLYVHVNGHVLQSTGSQKKDAGEGGHLEHVQCCRYDYETTLNSYDQELY